MENQLLPQENVSDRTSLLKKLLCLFVFCLAILVVIVFISSNTADGVKNPIVILIMAISFIIALPLTVILPIIGIRQLYLRKKLQLTTKAKALAIVAIFAILPDLIAILFIGYIISRMFSGVPDSW